MTAQGRPILITGASRGIGKAIALTLSRAGWPTVCWARSHDDLVAMAIEAEGPQPFVQCVDLADPDGVRSAAAVLDARGISVGGVILNAGAGRWKAFDEHSIDDWRATQAVNVDGHVQTLLCLLPGLKRLRSGMIIGILSDSALYPFAGRTAYSTAKAALRMMLESLRREVRPYGIRVGLVFPSRVDTHFQGSRSAAAPGSRPRSLAADEVAEAVLYMLARPPEVEIQEVRIGSMASSFGPFEEHVIS